MDEKYSAAHSKQLLERASKGKEPAAPAPAPEGGINRFTRGVSGFFKSFRGGAKEAPHNPPSTNTMKKSRQSQAFVDKLNMEKSPHYATVNKANRSVDRPNHDPKWTYFSPEKLKAVDAMY